jgi:hypothetical protein
VLEVKRLLMAGAICALCGACRRVATQPQCDAIVDRYVDLVARQQDGGDLATAKAHVREMAEADEDFRSCTTHVEIAQYECAMRAMTPEALEKCLE